MLIIVAMKGVMKANFWSTPRFWLLSISAGVAAVHLNVIWQSEDPNLTAASFLIGGAVFSSLQERYHHLKLESAIVPSLIGAVLIFSILVKTLFLTGGTYFPKLSPLVSATGLALIASGFTGIKQYWKELVMLGLLGIPEILFSLLLDPTPLTAQFAGLALWYGGFDVVKEGVNIYLPTGAIEVYPGCSGVQAMAQLFSFAVLFLLMFPTRWSQKLFIPLAAIVIGFVINGFRVALLGLVVSNETAFKYWHDGGGSLIFSAVGVGLLGMLCIFLLWRNQQLEEEMSEQ